MGWNGEGMAKAGSSGKHGGGHKDRQRGKDASTRKQIERDKQAKIRAQRGERDKSGKKPKPDKDDGGGIEEFQ